MGVLGSGSLNMSTFFGVCILTGENIIRKYFWRCVVDVNENPPMKLYCIIFSQLGFMKAQTCLLEGMGYNLSSFGHFVRSSTYFVHSFLRYEALMKN